MPQTGVWCHPELNACFASAPRFLDLFRFGASISGGLVDQKVFPLATGCDLLREPTRNTATPGPGLSRPGMAIFRRNLDASDVAGSAVDVSDLGELRLQFGAVSLQLLVDILPQCEGCGN